MEKVFKILAVFILLILVIVYSVQVREKRFRAFSFSRRINLSPMGKPEQSLTIDMIVPEEGGLQAFDREENLSFYAGDPDFSLMVADTSTGQILVTVPLEEPIDLLLYDPFSRLIFCSNAEGMLSIIKQNGRQTYKVVQRMSIPRDSNGLALDPHTGKLYIYGDGAIYVYTNV